MKSKYRTIEISKVAEIESSKAARPFLNGIHRAISASHSLTLDPFESDGKIAPKCPLDDRNKGYDVSGRFKIELQRVGRTRNRDGSLAGNQSRNRIVRGNIFEANRL